MIPQDTDILLFCGRYSYPTKFILMIENENTKIFKGVSLLDFILQDQNIAYSYSIVGII